MNYCREPFNWLPGSAASAVYKWCEFDVPPGEISGFVPTLIGNFFDTETIYNNIGEPLFVSELSDCSDVFFSPTFEELSIIDVDVLEADSRSDSAYNSMDIKEAVNSEIICNAYPNPFHDFINIEILLKNSSTVLISIHDILSNELYLEEKKVINGVSQFKITDLWESLSTGTYILKVVDEHGNVKSKLLIKQ